jgi:uncharacterized membrane protein
MSYGSGHMMSVSRLLRHFPTLALTITLAGCTTTPTKPESQTTGPKVDFVTQIKPILLERCVMCHNRKTMPDRTSFESAALAMKGDTQGPVILPGKAAGSRMIAAISSPDFHDKAMPPVSLRVTASEVALFRQWIDQGAAWPSGKDGEIVPHSIPLE